MPAGSFEGQYVWHPAADDRRLARACTEVRAGRYFNAHELLRETRGDFDLRAHRSLVLASEAADSDLAERWLAEEPGPESALLWARVAMVRALRTDGTDDPRLPTLVRIARSAGDRAAAALPEDPTPWVVRLALSPLHGRASDPAPPGLLTAPAGPWHLFRHILRMAPWHREAHHRFLAFFFARHSGTASARWDVASFLSQRAPRASALRLLPLVALVEDYDASALLARRIWEQPQWRKTALGICHDWFPRVSEYRFTPVLDLAYLAHALFMAKCDDEARAVFRAMGPYASRMPWSVFGDPEEQLTKARRLCGLPVPDAE